MSIFKINKWKWDQPKIDLWRALCRGNKVTYVPKYFAAAEPRRDLSSGGAAAVLVRDVALVAATLLLGVRAAGGGGPFSGQL